VGETTGDIRQPQTARIEATGFAGGRTDDGRSLTSSTGRAGGFHETRAAVRSDHQDLVTKMERYAGKVAPGRAIARIAAALAERQRQEGLDDRHDGTVEGRRAARCINLHELARFFAAAVVVGVAMISGRFGAMSVIVVMIAMRMDVPTAHDGQELRFVATCRQFNVLMMPAATDQRVHQQREGGDGGDQMTHARSSQSGMSKPSMEREAYRIHRDGDGPY